MASTHLCIVAGAVLLFGLLELFTVHDVQLDNVSLETVKQLFDIKSLSSPQIAKRVMIENFLSKEDCDVMVNMLQRHLVPQFVGDQLFGLNLPDINNKNFTLHERQVVVRTREEILRVTRAHFNNPLIYAENTHLALRKPGIHSYSHGVHCDQCRINLKTLECEVRPDACCGWRHITSVLYLNDPDGGDFLYHDYDRADVAKGITPMANITRIRPVPGTLVFFTSGPENLHAVEPVKSGHRDALNFWMTLDKTYEERLPPGFLEEKY